MTELRSGLPPLTERIKKLPIDKRGYPIPRFVQWVKFEDGKPFPCKEGEGEPDFRITSVDWLWRCVIQHVCWICGEKLGVFRAYNIGPLDAIQRVSVEPPSHLECAEYAVKSCPFMLNPNLDMRNDEVSQSENVVLNPEMILKNPGVFAIWIVKQLHEVSRHGPRLIFKLPPPVDMSWWKEGRRATSEEVMDAIYRDIERIDVKRAPEQIALKRNVNELKKFIEKLKIEAKKNETLFKESRPD